MIQSFKCSETAVVFQGKNAAKFGNLCRVCHRKLLLVHHAKQLSDLRVPPGNRLEPLPMYGTDYYGIRVNDRWRLVFQWKNGHTYNVEILDYH